MRWTRILSAVGLVAPLLGGCKGSSPTPAASNTAQPAVTTTAAAPASAAAPPPPSGVACTFDRGLTGTIGPANVFVLLTRTGDDLAGTYFYEKTGGDLALKGMVTGSSFSLTESTGGKATGTMTGTCQAGGALTGTWTSPDGKRTLPLALSVPARITVGTRKLKFTTKGKGEAGNCEFNRTMPVVLGAPSAAAERRMAEAIAAAAKEVADPAHERDARACKPDQDGFTLSYFDGGFTVASQDANVLVLQFSAGINVTPSAHPANFAGATVLDLDLATGNALQPKDVVTDEARVVALAQQCSDTDIQLSEAEPAFILRPHGIQVVGTSYGHAIAVATFQGPELSYAALLRDGLLKTGSPIAREWAGEKPAAPGATPCRTRWKLSE